MNRPTHTKTGRKISDELTDVQAHFAVWMSDEGQALIGDASITEAQRISKMLEVAFIAGSESIDVKEIEAVAGRAGFIAGRSRGIENFKKIIGVEYFELTEAQAADQYAAKVRQGGGV